MIHNIDEEWELQTLNIGKSYIKTARTGESLAEVLDKKLSEFSLDVFCCTNDTNMNSALRKSDRALYDIGCLAHILQLSIKDSLIIQSCRNIISLSLIHI